jgi:hypothetical protein
MSCRLVSLDGVRRGVDRHRGLRIGRSARIPCLEPHEIHRLDGLAFERAGRLPLR